MKKRKPGNAPRASVLSLQGKEVSASVYATAGPINKA
jgi:hypothetical protein